MRLIIIILTITSISFCNKGNVSASPQIADTQKILGVLRPPETLIVIMGGESNEPGEALNSDATAAEKLPRRAQMWNVSVERFQKLILGYNNVGTFPTTHGIELQLANLLDSADFGQNNLYMIKTGQGTTRTADWMPDTYLFQRMIYRVDKAISQMANSHGSTAELWLFFTLGLNDIFFSYPTADFKDDMGVIFDALHTRYPTLKIIMTKFNQPGYPHYNTTIQELDDEIDYVWALDATDAPLLGDAVHWDYQGYKVLGRRVRDIINAN